MCLKSAGPEENGGDPDQTIHSAWSDLGLHCLLWSVCQNNKVNRYEAPHYGNMPIFKYSENFTTKNENFQIKNSDIFSYFC